MTNSRYYRNQIWITKIFLLLTIVACSFAGFEMFGIFWEQLLDHRPFAAIGQVAFFITIALLTYGNFVYQFTRIGYFKRLLKHSPVSRAELEKIYKQDCPPLAVLVPSYKEELDVVRETLLSAALQDYPNRRVVLLIDDPPKPKSYADFEALQNMRALPNSLQRKFNDTAYPFIQARKEYLERKFSHKSKPLKETERLIQLYKDVTFWFQNQVNSYDDPAIQKELPEHIRAFMRDFFFKEWSILHLERVSELESLWAKGGADPERIEKEYNRLAFLFCVNFSTFERKKYLNLSHLPNKAMNLNSYITLLGKRWKEREDSHGIFLEESNNTDFSFEIPEADLLVTLDADSVLLPDYILKLSHVLSSPENEKIAVAQTPYSSFSGSLNVLENMAGATTDIQYQIHQGFTHFGATFWVGANAMLRYKALLDIRTVYEERGFQIHKYIQDNTVIEDTESSIDLLDVNWNLYNYPERLAYSATPPDFGSLLIQRRRWANGGLIILPKLLRYVFRRPWSFVKFMEAFFRVHYLGSIAAVNIGLVILMGSPLGEGMETYWIAVSSLPYFILYGMDLVRIGYKWIDLIQVYSLNLLLIPVNLAGVFMSINQAITGKQIPFSRTPKVIGRTAIPALYVVAEYSLLAQLLFGFITNYLHKNWIYSIYNLGNAFLLGYGIIKFIGLRFCWEDILLSINKPPVEISEKVAHLVEPRVTIDLEGEP
ncbi:glycosyltransferase family 2 protein [Leptospira borgpetersenii]|uniref:glycosyltransferase family 2 protein n=1 Tax=Leptospira borgpetersenii TaxID=174 RepID=UPI000774327C|nr:glycosyltransferase family 2 protein [Leptospira borgpetersenii]MBE8400778.1 glycosyltransferase [Leptospira borgpetersenii serovar Tarassovi]MBE8403724.1 glycosyltransferase [Leptospira borgpetersenii serovar Tarassovi]MBE8405567.1 glycosyltransferase [Leptospira borgpetersenii serovar Tarassovi]MBE8411690.1 glycosyltransferase [Leptospira borgpetersenii serovar Tarassovi]MBE8416064.1 glycosyltransferase [Leptospira borgpetersenii serovar Tarassovi]